MSDYWSNEYKQRLLSEYAELRDALTEIRDIARSELKPDVLTEKEYREMKMRTIAKIANGALLVSEN